MRELFTCQLGQMQQDINRFFFFHVQVPETEATRNYRIIIFILKWCILHLKICFKERDQKKDASAWIGPSILSY